MAKVELNQTVAALRGKIENWVYRQQDGKTIVTPYRAPKSRKPSPAQKQARTRFQAAHAYATEVLSDPLRRLVYQKLGAERKRPPNALLASNFLTPPLLEKIDLTAYTGRAGEIIRIVAFDPIEVTAVNVTIRPATGGGGPIESGAAVQDHGVWGYRATVKAPASTPLQIEVTAHNRARAEAKQVMDAGSA
jgi:hypothetical protein